MAMNAGTLATAMTAAILSAISAFENEVDDHRLTGKTQTDFWTYIAGAISSTVVDHITSNANATGTDSRGDTHALSIV